MNRQLSQAEINDALSFIQPVAPVMTRREKLLRWSGIVRNCRSPIFIFHNLEYWPKSELNHINHPDSAFALAYRDPKLREAGLKSDFAGDAMKFFELTQNQLHEFSCDCGGEISSKTMADRIEKLANA